jgi:hypothetical protein
MEPSSRVACPEELLPEGEVDLALWPDPNFSSFRPKDKRLNQQAPKRQRRVPALVQHSASEDSADSKSDATEDL